MLGKPIKLHGG